MQNFWTKSLAVTAVTGAMLAGGAGMASADTGHETENQVDETVTQVTGNGIEDTGNIWLGDFLNGLVDLGDVASNNNILNGNDTDLTDNLNGNTADVDVDPNVESDVDPNVDSDVDADSSADSTTDGGEDNELGLLGGLL